MLKYLTRIIPKKFKEKKEQNSPKDLELLSNKIYYFAKNDFLNELVLLKVKIHKKLYPLPKPNKFYERYPNLKSYNGNGYIHTIDAYIEKISEEVEKINTKASGANIGTINNLMDGLEHYIREYPKKQ